MKPADNFGEKVQRLEGVCEACAHIDHDVEMFVFGDGAVMKLCGQCRESAAGTDLDYDPDEGNLLPDKQVEGSQG